METDKCKRPFSYRATLFVALSCVFLHNITHVALADTPTPTDTQQPPVAVAEKEQVTYRIQYIDEATGEPLARSITKIAFENDLVTEKAVRISGYELVSDSSQSLTARQNETIVFVYRKQDPQLLLTLRAEKMTQVDSLPHISAAEKDAYKMKIAHAQSVEEIDRLFRELKEKNDAAKVMITYRVKYVDATTNRDVTRTVSKLAFSGDRITEQASQVAGYELISDRTQSVVLTADRNQEIVFTYHKIDEQQFEKLIEASLLYGVSYDDIVVTVHPQSIVHSMVEFCDGSTLAQASPPDMRLPIGLALTWPERLPGASIPCDWSRAATWTFEPLDAVTFPAVDLARRAGKAAGTAPAVYNAANEVLVDAFCTARIGFLQITELITRCLEDHLATAHIADEELTVEAVLAADAAARAQAIRLVEELS